MSHDEFYGNLLKRSSSNLWKLTVCTCFGATFFLTVVLVEENLRDQWVFALLGGAVLGLFGGALLVLRDARRNRTNRWRAKCELRSQELLDCGEAENKADALRMAQAQVAEETSGCIVWTGMILGGFILLCAAIMAALKAVEFVRRVL